MFYFVIIAWEVSYVGTKSMYHNIFKPVHLVSVNYQYDSLQNYHECINDRKYSINALENYLVILI